MASIRNRGGKWQAQIRRGREFQSATFDTKAAAERWARRIERDLDESRASGKRPTTATVKDLIERYAIDTNAARPIGRTKAAGLNQLRDRLGHIKLRDLSREHVIEFARLRQTEDGAGPATIGMDLAFLHTVLRAADELYNLGVGPKIVKDARAALSLIRVIDKPRERERRPTEQELDMLRRHWLSNSRQLIPMADVMDFAVASAFRMGEILSIRWDDLDVAGRVVLIRDRKDPRRKESNNQLAPLIEAHGLDPLEIILRQARSAPLIFPYSVHSVSTAFTRAVRACGIDDLHFHDLRHEGASRLFELGLSIEHVSLVTGHRRWSTLRRYTQTRAAHVVETARLLGQQAKK